ncbi:hypothetical protein [Pelagibacterium xiamenense]|uniref:hypothetical protein n=1 Tax=Pelagibacterium xiamenense TaxID=2901140 RepID=UPI001E4E3CF4|nr:hypothetical protein [Pelagibacterium xiamenense]MCD7060223.1 hypothetical protein [Pelagibacterium xiamenense]
MKTNPFFALTAILCGLVVPMHVFGGGPEFPDIVIASGLDGKQSAMYMILWHAVTVLLIGSTIVYAAAARSARFRAAVLVVNGQFCAIAVLFLAYGMMDLGSIWVLPQWVLFFALAAISAPGFIARRKTGALA